MDEQRERAVEWTIGWMDNKTTDWRHLREFRHVDLSQSFVLSWEFSANSLLVDVDLFICREHPFYEAPRPAEKACFRAAHIDFPHCSTVSRAGENADATVQGAIQRLQGGKITGLTRTGEGRYEVSGEFGNVVIHAERPMVRLKDRMI